MLALEPPLTSSGSDIFSLLLTAAAVGTAVGDKKVLTRNFHGDEAHWEFTAVGWQMTKGINGVVSQTVQQ